MRFVLPEKWLSSGEVAEMLGVTQRTVENWRGSGKGPAYARIGSNIRYREEDVLAWVEANMVKPSASKSKEEDAA